MESTASTGLSAEAARTFLEQKLNIESQEFDDILSRGDRVRFLNLVCSSFQESVPFHGLRQIGKTPEDRQAPSVEECLSQVLSGAGGLCWTLNAGLCSVLGALGFDSSLVLGSCFDGDSDDHAVVLVRNVRTPGDSFLADVGFGEPGFQVVCLDFEEESETIEESFRIYKIMRRRCGSDAAADDGDDSGSRGDNTCYMRVEQSRNKREKQDENNSSKGSATNDGSSSAVSSAKDTWKLAYAFDTRPQDPEAVRLAINKSVYMNDDHFLNTTLRLVRFRHGKLVAIKDDSLIQESDAHKLESVSLRDSEDILDTMSRHFPEIPRAMTQRAVEFWDRSRRQTQEVSQTNESKTGL